MKRVYKTTKLANLANFKFAAKPIKQGTWSTLSNLANFLFVALRGLKDFTAPDTASKPEVIWSANLAKFKTAKTL